MEPGLAEALYLCENPPGFEDPEKLKRKYPLGDTSYKPVFTPPLPREGYGDDACTPRLRKTLEGILERFDSGIFKFSTGCIEKNRNLDDFFMFSIRNFFSKILKLTHIGVIL